MAMKKWKIRLALLLLFALCYDARTLFGCGPGIDTAVFTYSYHPDLPLDGFARGEIGVLQAKYARSYLCVAYRYLLGLGLDSEEQRAVTELWQKRLDFHWYDVGDQWIKEWNAARSKVTGVGDAPKIEVYRGSKYFAGYVNCPSDAFKSAARTLSDRIQQFGADSTAIKDWVQAQDQVFANCAHGETIPAAVTANVPPLLRADRAYQIAAARFYAGDLNEAVKLFDEIAADTSSPWRQLAPYLAARAVIRLATVPTKPDEADRSKLAEAEKRFQQILSDPHLGTTHDAARRMLSFVRFRLRPVERAHELATALLKKNSGSAIKQDLDDYTWLLDKFETTDLSTQLNTIRQDDLTDWLFTFKAEDKASLDHALQKWREQHTLPWLIAALSKVTTKHLSLPELIAAADQVAPSSPGFASVFHHRIRLLMESGQKDEARQQLDRVLSANQPKLPRSTHNLLLSQRMQLARNLDEFIKFAQRMPTGITNSMDGEGEIPIELTHSHIPKHLEPYTKGLARLDADSTEIMNKRLPLSLIKSIAFSSSLPAHLRRQVALAAWVRAVILDQDETAQSLAAQTIKLMPELKDSFNAYLTAESREARQFAAIYLMLKHPGTRPYVDPGVGRITPVPRLDDYRDNWWCAPELKQPLDFPDFLTPMQEATANSEWQKLMAFGAAANYLCQQASAWAKKKPTDPRVPEVLHLAVKSSHYGCTDKATAKFAKQAFQILHRQYPNSSWAKKTKYYYGG